MGLLAEGDLSAVKMGVAGEGFVDGDELMRYKSYIYDGGGCEMPISLRIPPKKEEMIKGAAKKEGKRRMRQCSGVS